MEIKYKEKNSVKKTRKDVDAGSAQTETHYELRSKPGDGDEFDYCIYHVSTDIEGIAEYIYENEIDDYIVVKTTTVKTMVDKEAVLSEVRALKEKIDSGVRA